MRPAGLAVLALVGCTEQPKNGAPEACTERLWFADEDGDGFGDNTHTTSACDQPTGYAVGVGDCDDRAHDIHPDATEVCDGSDNDCNGQTDDQAADAIAFYADADGDGFGDDTQVTLACELPPGHVASAGDCDDGAPEIYPGAPEICDLLDNDCDGVVPDEESDGDGDGHVGCVDDCAPEDPYSHPGAEEVCDDVDNDCNGLTDDAPVDGFWLYPDADGDGYGLTGGGVQTCADLSGWLLYDGDCDDGAADVAPDQVEMPADGVDQNCDGEELCWQDLDLDGVGAPIAQSSPSLDCAIAGVSPQSDDCDDADDQRYPGNAETAYDGLDNDCDPLTPDDDLDGDGYDHVNDCDDWDPMVFPEPGATSFTEMARSAGLSAIHWDPSINPFECFPWLGMAAGVAVADMDQDGFLDVFITRLQLPDLLYRNVGDGTFQEEAAARGISHTGSSATARWFDADADGDLDLFVASVGLEDSRLYIQDAAGEFTEEAVARGVDTPRASPLECSNIFGVSVADYDADGDLDLHTDAWFLNNAPGIDRSYLLQNDGAGYFTDDTLASGLDLYGVAAFASAFIDYDDDGDLDFSVAADWGTTQLFENQGDATFTPVTASAQIVGTGNAMGSTWADYDRDGDLDWFTSAIYDPTQPCNPVICDGNRLFANNGDGTFTDNTDLAGVRRGGWGWGAAFFDADNDGDLDLGQVDGPHQVAMAPSPTRLFVNDGQGVFTDKSCDTGLLQVSDDRAFVPFDFDNDGDLDLLITAATEPPRLYENLDNGDNSWIRIVLSDPTTPGNQRAIGSRIIIEAEPGAAPQRGDIHANEGFGAQLPAEAHFGFGAYQGPLYQVAIRWPDGGVDLLFDVPPRQILTVDRSGL